MVLGVTGNIASGKSAVSDILRSLGATVVSADQLSREVVRPGSPTLSRIVKRFGAAVLKPDGTLNREALAERVFADPDERRALEAIVHPAIAALAERRLAELKVQGEELIVYEAPLLFEAGARERVDAVLVVRIDEDRQMQRLMARDGLSESRARARIDAQMAQEEKVSRADFVIDNSGTPADLDRQVRALYRRLTASRRPLPGAREKDR